MRGFFTILKVIFGKVDAEPLPYCEDYHSSGVSKSTWKVSLGRENISFNLKERQLHFKRFLSNFKRHAYKHSNSFPWVKACCNRLWLIFWTRLFPRQFMKILWTKFFRRYFLVLLESIFGKDMSPMRRKCQNSVSQYTPPHLGQLWKNSIFYHKIHLNSTKGWSTLPSAARLLHKTA